MCPSSDINQCFPHLYLGSTNMSVVCPNFEYLYVPLKITSSDTSGIANIMLRTPPIDFSPIFAFQYEMVLMIVIKICLPLFQVGVYVALH